MANSVFAAVRGRSFPYRYQGTIEVEQLVGGIPSNPDVAKAWLETKLKNTTTDEQLQRMVAETMVERKVSADEALDIVNKLRNLNGFKSDEEGLYYEGRQLKAALKEAVSVAASVDKIKIQGWGSTRKWIQGFFPEHVFVLQRRLHLNVPERDENGVILDEEKREPATSPTGILQQFVHTRFGSSIQYQEYVEQARFDFTVVTDHPFTRRDWEAIWTTGEMNGLGASRSQGYGTYRVIRWEEDFDRSVVKKLQDEADEVEDLGNESGPVVRTRAPRTRAKVAA
jgi:hypothetical protein